jgi:hypothetical protein
MDEWREDGSDRNAPVRAKDKANGLPYGGDVGTVAPFVPAFRPEFEELPAGHGIPGDRRLRWRYNPAHPLHDHPLATWALPNDPGDRLFSKDWAEEVESRYQLFVQAIHEDNVSLLNLLDLVNFVDPKIGFPMRSDMPAGQLDVMYFEPEDRQWVFYPQYRPYRYSTYCTGFGKPMVAAWFQAQEASLKYAHVYYGEEATTRPQSYFRSVESFPGV